MKKINFWNGVLKCGFFKRDVFAIVFFIVRYYSGCQRIQAKWMAHAGQCLRGVVSVPSAVTAEMESAGGKKGREKKVWN